MNGNERVIDQRYKTDEKPENIFCGYDIRGNHVLDYAGNSVFCYCLYYNDVFYVYDHNTYL